MADRPKARLTQAFAWVCDSCGRDNFASAVAVEERFRAERETMRSFNRGWFNAPAKVEGQP